MALTAATSTGGTSESWRWSGRFPRISAGFKSLMTRFLPDWAERKRRLNRGPAAHGDWTC